MTRIGKYGSNPGSDDGRRDSIIVPGVKHLSLDPAVDVQRMPPIQELGDNSARFWKPFALLCSIASILFFICAVIAVVVLATRREDTEEINDTQKSGWAPPSDSIYKSFRHASIVSDNGLCNEVGRDVMLIGGNAVDAAIAATLCTGVVNPQSSGLGGGFLMTLFNKTTGRCVTIDARETAPASATQTMYVDNPEDSGYGYKSIAVPSELHGFYTAFTRFGSGNVTWQRLVEPSMNLAKRGFPVTYHLANKLKLFKEEVLVDEYMAKEFTNPMTGRLYEEGDIMKRETLAKTLELIGKDSDPIGLFYQHGMAQSIAAEINKNGGYVTAQDLADYETVVEEEPLVVEDLPGGLSMCGPPPPSSFVVLQAIVRTMARFYNGNVVNLDDPLVYHRLIESMKFAYAQRTKLGDTRFVKSAEDLVEEMLTPDFISSIALKIKDHALKMEDYTDAPMSMPEDHGTSHVSAIDAEGNAVSCTSTVNQEFGAKKISPLLGIIWNDQMNDFSTPGQSDYFGLPPAVANFIAPGKRPMSSMSPTIVYNKEGEVQMVAGASGGSHIISSTAQVVIHELLFKQGNVKESVDAPRFHHQFLPHTCKYEHTVPQEIVEALRTRFGQNMTGQVVDASVVNALKVSKDGQIQSNSDWRRKIYSYPAGF